MKAKQTSYDLVPYSSYPYEQSRPDRLFVMAKLFGLTPKPIRASRVLEIGCSSGGNLLPLADAHDSAEFVGVDLSVRQIEVGKQILAKLNRSNVTLLHKDIAEIEEDFGQFDYVIAHGVFSWIAPVLQRKLLDVCRKHLAPQGVAFISYNTKPGWALRGAIRDMLIYRVKNIEDPSVKVARARSLLRFLAESVPVEGNPYGGFLQQELELFEQSEDSYLFHDHLEGYNTPIYFHQFVDEVERAELQFLSESHLSVMASNNFAKDVDATLQELSGDLIEMEQYMDFLRNRSFRQSLICHRSCKLDRSMPSDVADGLYVTSKLKEDEAESVFRAAGIVVESKDPGIQCLHRLLCNCSPQAVSLAEAFAEAVPSSERGKQALWEHVLRCFACEVFELHSESSSFVSRVGIHPRCGDHARIQAQSTHFVTNAKHQPITIDQFGRKVMQFCDGAHDVSQIKRKLGALVESGDVELGAEEQEAFPNRSELCDAKVDRALEQLCANALLLS